ncbi:MAG TPA: TetR/AcrR family transcriptional regulator [Actinocrinis sp.]|nr:TetR/AcrR family transcriptional regulator [Actinocrinis sp.]
MSTRKSAVSRTHYHHGDLRNALSGAALELARQGGPEAVVLREAARRVGVSATAAYRYFDGQNQLLTEVKRRALGALARILQESLGECGPADGSGALAVARLTSAAYAYIDFAFTEPGLFNTAFCRDQDAAPGDPLEISYDEVNAFQVLGQLLDELVAVGLMPPQRRPLAEFAAWSGVHGLAVLFLDGPLRNVVGDERAAALEYSVKAIVRSLISPED